MTSILRPLRPLEDLPGFADAFAAAVAEAAGHVCTVCGLERMGHAPESRWLGFERHAWDPRPATAAELEQARELTGRAYAARGSARESSSSIPLDLARHTV